QDVQNWYPSMRLTTPQSSTLGRDILGFQAIANPVCQPTVGYQDSIPPLAILQNEVAAPSNMKVYGYDTDTPPMVAGPLTKPTAATAGGGGNLNGTYTFVVTWWTTSGESYASPSSDPISVTNQNINLSNILTGTGVTARGIYAFKTGASSYYQLAGIIPNNTATTFTIDVDLCSSNCSK